MQTMHGYSCVWSRITISTMFPKFVHATSETGTASIHMRFWGPIGTTSRPRGMPTSHAFLFKHLTCSYRRGPIGTAVCIQVCGATHPISHVCLIKGVNVSYRNVCAGGNCTMIFVGYLVCRRLWRGVCRGGCSAPRCKGSTLSLASAVQGGGRIPAGCVHCIEQVGA
jgi:hypothetical protein